MSEYLYVNVVLKGMKIGRETICSAFPSLKIKYTRVFLPPFLSLPPRSASRPVIGQVVRDVAGRVESRRREAERGSYAQFFAGLPLLVRRSERAAARNASERRRFVSCVASEEEEWPTDRASCETATRRRTGRGGVIRLGFVLSGFRAPVPPRRPRSIWQRDFMGFLANKRQDSRPSSLASAMFATP